MDIYVQILSSCAITNVVVDIELTQQSKSAVLLNLRYVMPSNSWK